MNNLNDQTHVLCSRIKSSKHFVVFSGAGMSLESGIPTFRGEEGIWSKYNPNVLDIDYFYSYPEKSWPVIREIFYDYFDAAKPNIGHRVLGLLQQINLLKAIITQNIDNLHQEGGAKTVYEFHGNSKYLICTKCQSRKHVNDSDLKILPVTCSSCKGLMKPDFIFFGEGIPAFAYEMSFKLAREADLLLIVGSTGEVMPAAMVPYEAKRSGAYVVEINPKPSSFTSSVTDLFIQAKAGETLNEVAKYLGLADELIN